MFWSLFKSLNFGVLSCVAKWSRNHNQRIYALQYKSIDCRGVEMSQAKTLTEKELRKVLDYIATRKHAARNRAMLMMTAWAGLRVGEVAALRVGDVCGADGSISEEIRLSAEQTKGRHARTVFVCQKLRKELGAYLKTIDVRDRSKPLFATQKRAGFTANTLCQHFHWLYKRAEIAGASSHSGRRSFITSLAAKGVGVRVLAALAGHKSIQTTQLYIDVNDDMKRRAVELV